MRNALDRFDRLQDWSFYCEYYKKDFAGMMELRLNDPHSLIDEQEALNRSAPDSGCVFAGRHGLRTAITEKEHSVGYLSEALITTYPTKKLVERFMWNMERLLDPEMLNFKSGAGRVVDDVTYYGWNKAHDVAALVVFCFPYRKHDEAKAVRVRDELIDQMYLCGYNYSASGAQPLDVRRFGDGIMVCKIQFEAVHQTNEIEFRPYFYHVTKYSRLKKILAGGLQPKERNGYAYRSDLPAMTFPSRIYLFNTGDPDKMIRFAGVNDKNGLFAIVRVDSAKLLTRLKKTDFYIDSVFEHGDWTHPDMLFTYGSILPGYIDDMVAIFELRNNTIRQMRYVKKQDFLKGKV